MSKVVSTLPTIWEEDVYTVLRLLKRHVDFINDELIPAINDNADDITTLFQSTHPGWGATAKVHKRRNGFYVLLRIFFHLCIKTIIFGAMLVCKPGKNLA